MISADAARDAVLSAVEELACEDAPLVESVGRVLAADVAARCDLPPFDNSAMDGYAVRSADLAGAGERAGVRLRVRQTVKAGAAATRALEPGCAARIFTGAPLPAGADAVVMQERVERRGEEAEFLFPAEPGDHIRPRGEDVRRGDPLLARGVQLRPYEIALLAAQGVDRVPVYRRPVVAVLATGDELVPSSQEPTAGRLRDSNGPALAAALSRWGALPRRLGIAPDEPSAQRRAFEAALEGADMLVVTGGVSVGDFDHTRGALESLGMETLFWKAAIKPGKPLLFGRRGRVPVFGLPGNPVAVLVCAEEFVRPAVETLSGRRPSHPPYHLTGTVLNEYPKPADRRQYLFCRARQGASGFELEVIRPQGSAMLGMASRANALAVGPEGTAVIEPGAELRFRWLK